MSAALVREFFPWTWNAVVENPKLLSGAWNLIFPPSTEELCPRPEAVIKILGAEYTVMWPLASVFCALGIVIGFWQGIWLLRNGLTQKGAFTWSCAFLWYGMMSIGGLGFHCLTKNKALYLLDVVSTACCCISIMAAYLASKHVFINDRSSAWRASLCLGYGAVLAAGIWGGQVIRELGLYVGPSLLAFGFCVCFCAREVISTRMMSSSQRIWLAGASVSSLVALASLPLDPWLCANLGANFSLLPWFFLGSDLAIFCLYRFTLAAGQHHHKAS